MGPKNEMADELDIGQIRDELETIMVRLVGIADRCREPPIQYELMRLGDELARVIAKMGE